MITQFEIDRALMAGAAYFSTRADINRIPIPQGWTERIEFRVSGDSSGFEARAFQKGNEIVIAYAGTNPADIFGDIAADIGLATGVGSDQLRQAAEYYLQVKAANPNATITFTGHSLGGGLAALMGVFFGKQAVTFDQAPFANSAEASLIPPDVAANLRSYLVAQLDLNGNRKYSDAALQGLTDFLAIRAALPMGEIPNTSLVQNINVDGEFLSGVPWNIQDRIGLSSSIPTNTPGVSGDDLHSVALLTAFLQSMKTALSGQTLNGVTAKLTDLMGMLFDENLYENPTNDPDNRNFLERLVQNEQGNAMVTRFTRDLWKLAQDGGLTMTDGPTPATNLVSKALIAFAMQMYYEDTANATTVSKELFTPVTGGVQFDRADVAASLGDAKGYADFHVYLVNNFSAADRQRIEDLLPVLRDWYVQAGLGGMNVADALNRGAFMLGGTGADNLTGGTQTDLLVGNAGIDWLNGGGGNDTLLGGAGFDTYGYNTGDGADTVNDRDDVGRLLVNGQLLSGGIRRAGDDPDTYHSTDNAFTFVQSGMTLTINGQLTVENWQPGDLGVTLRDLSTLPTGTAPVIDCNNGLPTEIYTATPESSGPNGAWGFVAQSDSVNYVVTGGSGPDDVYADTVVFHVADQVVYGGAGSDRIQGALNDRLFGEAGDDVILGGRGQDMLDGGEGRDILAGDYYDAPGANDYLDGGAENIFLIQELVA